MFSICGRGQVTITPNFRFFVKVQTFFEQFEPNLSTYPVLKCDFFNFEKLHFFIFPIKTGNLLTGASREMRISAKVRGWLFETF